MRKTSKLPVQRRISTTKLLAILLAAAIVAGIASAILIKAADNRTIADLKEQIAQLTPAFPAEQQPQATASAYAPTDAAAEYNGGVITVQEASDAYSTTAAYYEMLGADPADYAEDAKRETIDNLVEDQILEAKAKEYGVYDLTDEQKAELEQEVQANFDAQVEYYMAFRFDDSQTDEQLRQNTIDYLNENGMSVDDLYKTAAANIWRDNLRDYITADVSVEESDVQEYYQKQVETAKISYAADFGMYESDREYGGAVVYNPAGVRTVQGILIPFSNDQITTYLTLQAQIEAGDTSKQAEMDALYDQIMPTAQEALNRARAGEDFAALMDEYSADETLKREPMRSTGYYVSAQSVSYSKAFIDAAMALEKIGDISDLVRMDTGIYILRYASDVPEGEVPYEQVRDQLMDGCLEEKKNVKYNTTVEGWIADANIVYHLDRF